MKHKALATVLVFLSYFVFAGHEKYSVNAGTKPGSSIMLSSSTAIKVEDPQYVSYLSSSNPVWGWSLNSGNLIINRFFEKSIKNRIVFSIDHSDYSKVNNGNSNYSITFNISYKKYDGTVFNQQPNKNITLNVNPNSNDKAVYEFEGGNTFTVNVVSISTNSSNASLQLEAEMDIERYYKFDPSVKFDETTLFHEDNEIATKGELEINWAPVIGAEEYELEWTLINSYKGSLDGSGAYEEVGQSSIPIDDKLFDLNSTRITTANNFYRIPFVYERGYLLYRVRALGRTQNTNWEYNVPGIWSTDMNSVNAPTLVSDFPNVYKSIVGLNEKLNWQSSITYAEDGKSKAVVSFADGSLRNRQSVTKLKSSDDIIVGETIYDFQGRPAINILPVPSNNDTKLQYVKNFNTVNNPNNPIDAEDYDYDPSGQNCGTTSPQILTGAGVYYSSSNSQLNENEFIPNANGYPYTQTEYTPDNTGRVRRQSGVGATHQLGTDHETKYFYGTPEQKDLDKLFGSEVGDALRYQKNMVVDANGQSSITYVDASGKTIATALAGNNPENLTKLLSNQMSGNGPSTITYDLLNKTLSTDNSGSLNILDLSKNTLSLNKTILVSADGPYDFSYSVIPPKYIEECNGTVTAPPNIVVSKTGQKCFDCVLDVKISLKNECGDELFTKVFPAGTAYTNSLSIPTATNDACGTTISNTVEAIFQPQNGSNTDSQHNLKPGNYSLEKTLTVNQAALDAYTANYLDTLKNPCILRLSDFKAAQNLFMDITGCGMTCETCEQKLGDEAQYTSPDCKVCLSHEEYLELKAECAELCNTKSERCDVAMTMLMADVSPTGQYGKTKYDSGQSDPNSTGVLSNGTFAPWVFELSVYNTWSNRMVPRLEAIDAYKKFENTVSQTNPLPYTPVSSYLLNEFFRSPKSNWRFPYNSKFKNQNDFDVLTKENKCLSYLDEDGNIAFVKIVWDNASGNFIPPVHPAVLQQFNMQMNSMSGSIPSPSPASSLIKRDANGDYYVEPKYLDNVEDFVNLFQTSWAQSLVIYHPEYYYYERCLQDTLSNDFDDNLTERDELTSIKDYLESASGQHVIPHNSNHDDFMFPVGRPSSSFEDINNNINDASYLSNDVIDPYFKNTGNGFADLVNMQKAMLNYRLDPNSAPSNPQYVSIWDVVYRITHCPNATGVSGSLCNLTSIKTVPGYVFSEDEYNIFKGLYLSLKQAIMARNDAEYAILNQSYNGCIGSNPSFDPFEYNFYNPSQFTITYPSWMSTFTPFNSWGFWPGNYQNTSQYYNYLQPCNAYSNYLYSKKTVRFATAKAVLGDAFGGAIQPCLDDEGNPIDCPETIENVLSEMGNQADLNNYQNCQQCPKAVNFESLLNGLATYSTVVNQLDLTNNSNTGVLLTCSTVQSKHTEYTNELAQDLFGVNAPEGNTFWKSVNIVNPFVDDSTTTVNEAEQAYINGTATTPILEGIITQVGSPDKTCNVKLIMPLRIRTPNGIPGPSTQIFEFANQYTFDDVVSFCCLKHNSSPYIAGNSLIFGSSTNYPATGAFVAKARVKVKPGDSLYVSQNVPRYRDIDIYGYTDKLDFENCQFEPVCVASREITHVRNLLNALLFKTSASATAAAFSTTPVDLDAIPYNGLMKDQSSNQLIDEFDAVLEPNIFNAGNTWYWVPSAAPSSNKNLEGYFSPYQSTSVPSQKIELSIQLPATSNFVATDIRKIVGVKKTNSAVSGSGDFTAYALVRNGASVKFEKVNCHITLLSAGSCSEEKVTQSFGGTNGVAADVSLENIISQSGTSGFVCELFDELRDLSKVNFTTANPTNVNVYTSSYTGTGIVPCSELLEVGSPVCYGPINCNYSITIPQGAAYTFSNIASISNIYLDPNYLVNSQSNHFIIECVVNTPIVYDSNKNTISGNQSYTVYLNGVSSCPVGSCRIDVKDTKPDECTLFGSNGSKELSETIANQERSSIPNAVFPSSMDQFLNYPLSQFITYNGTNYYGGFTQLNNIGTADHSGFITDHTTLVNPLAADDNAIKGRQQTNIELADQNNLVEPFSSVKFIRTLEAGKSYVFEAYFRGMPNNVYPPTYTNPNNLVVENPLVMELFANGQFVARKINGSKGLSWNKFSASISNTSTLSQNTLFELKCYYIPYDNTGNVTYYPPTNNVNNLPAGKTYTLQPNLDIPYLIDDITLVCDNNPNSTACYVPPPVEEGVEEDCAEYEQNAALEGAQYNYEQYLDGLRKDFRDKYVQKCLDAFEKFEMTCNDVEHHYTLYYYDQAGNLIKTVPPQGVNKISSEEVLEQVRLDRRDNTHKAFTEHSYITNYKYNSLNQLVSQSVPDNKDMDIWKTSNFSGVPANLSVPSVVFDNNKGLLTANDGTNGFLYSFNSNTNSWQQIPALKSESLNDIAFVNTNGTDILYAVGENGTVLKSTDNANTWSFMPFPYPNADLLRVYPIHNTGALEAFDKLGNRYVSINEGISWSTNSNYVFIPSGAEYLRDLKLNVDLTNYQNTRGVAVTNQNRIFEFNGVVWAETGNNTIKQVALNDIDAITGTNPLAFAVGNDGTLLRSGDGGLNWQEVPSNLKDNITKVVIGSGYNGIYVIENGTPKNSSPVAGSNGFVFSSLSNGTNYVDLKTSPDRSRIFAMASNGDVLSSNGNVNSQPSGLYVAISPVNNTNYVIAGNSGIGEVILQYYNNGTFKNLNSDGTNVIIPNGETVNCIGFEEFIESNGCAYLKGYVATSSHVYYFNNADVIGSGSCPEKQNPFTPFSTIGTITKIAIANNEAYGITSTGQLKKYSAASDLLISPTTNANLKSFAFTNSADIVVVGDNSGEGHIASINVSAIANNLSFTNKSYQVKPTELYGVATDGYNNYVVGADGTVLKKNNDPSTGQNSPSTNGFWVNQNTNTNTQLNCIVIPTANNVVAIGKRGVTADEDDYLYCSGSTWLKSNNTISNFSYAKTIGNDVYFTGPNKAAALLNINNLGQPLTAISNNGSTNSYEGFNAIAANLNNTNATIVGQDGVIYQFNSSSNQFENKTNFNPPILNDIKWFDNSHVIAVGNDGKVLVSDDAANTWKAYTFGTNNFNAVAIKNANTAVAVGVGGTNIEITFSCSGNNCVYTAASASLLNTSVELTDIAYNNGTMVISSGNGVYYKTSGASMVNFGSGVYNAVYMVDDTKAFAVGNSGKIVKIDFSQSTISPVNLLSNNGQTWPQFLLNSVTSLNLNGVYFKDHAIGYAVGDNGFIMKTTNGGTSWQLEASPNSIGANSNITAITPNTTNGSFILGSSTGATGSIIDNKDEISSRFYYDKLGRLIASQNAKQFASNPFKYSITAYDELGRIYVVAELTATSDIETLPNNNNQIDYSAFLNWVQQQIQASGGVALKQETMTNYDTPISASSLAVPYDGPGTFVLENTQNRVVRVAYADDYFETQPASATYYSYDVHGNVKTLYQYNSTMPAGHKYKRIDYDYDLISGKVNAVHYQNGTVDQFHHKYEYDDDNRITNVFTSKDNVIWDQDAKYFYYRHGPLARVELGDNKVQGTDYAYTLQGWIKGVNSNKLSPQTDMGHDAVTINGAQLNEFVSTDAMGYHLGYYNGDYTAIGNNTQFLANNSLLASTQKQLFNGNISQTSYSHKHLLDQNLGRRTTNYTYDQLNRIIATANFDGFNESNNAFNNTQTHADAYNEGFSYDANGNILNLMRKDKDGALLDSLTYKYYKIGHGYTKNTNQLAAVKDNVSTADATDIETQPFTPLTPQNNNYQYDEIGNLIKDEAEKIDNIEWNVYGKIKSIKFNALASGKHDLVFDYDPSGNRIAKHLFNLGTTTLHKSTFYVRDAQGNVMSTYEVDGTQTSANLKLAESHIYGSSRLGVLNRNEDLITSTTFDFENAHRLTGDKLFELSNHLGNVLTVISDKKIPVDENNDGTVDYFKPDIVSATDYYSFGSPISGRNFSPNAYKYEMNGQEKDDEVFQGVMTAEYWEYDSRSGRRWNTDRVVKPWESPYACFLGNPIYFADPRGLDGEGPNGECPGDANVCEDGSTEIYGRNGVTGEVGWYQFNNSGGSINGNPNPIDNVNYKNQYGKRVFAGSDFASHLASKILGRSDVTKYSWKYIPNPYATVNFPDGSSETRAIGFMGFDQTFNELCAYGSYYELSYDGTAIGSFQVKGGLITYDGAINYDATGDLAWAISIYGGSSSVTFSGIVADGLANNDILGMDVPSMGNTTSSNDKFRFATFPPNMHPTSKEWKSFQKNNGLSNSQAAPFWSFYKRNGYVTMKNGKPILQTMNQINIKVSATKTIIQGMKPAMNVVNEKSKPAN